MLFKNSLCSLFENMCVNKKSTFAFCFSFPTRFVKQGLVGKSAKFGLFQFRLRG